MTIKRGTEMKRLTEHTDHGVVVREELDICVETPEDFDNLQHILATLAAYEDTGLTPDRIREIDRLFAEKCRQLAVLTENFKALSKSHNERMDAEEHGCSGWIPVTEHLPNTSGKFEVTIKGSKGKRYVDMCDFQKDAFPDWRWGGRYNAKRVIAWKARPIPYKEMRN